MATMPEPADWSAAYARVQQLADRDVLRLLQQAYRDVNNMLKEMARREGIGAAVRREQLQTVKRNLLREQAAIFNRLGDIVSARRVEAAARAVRLGATVDSVLLTAAGRSDLAASLSRALTRGLEQSINVALVRLTQSQIPLSERIYRTKLWMDDRLQRKIASALLRGLGPREFAAEARAWFNPRVPGGTRYAALRLARSEINNAFHAISINQAAEKPWVEGMQWHLSGSHPKTDICDEYAHGGTRGDGIYAPRDVPRKPHPQCFCFVTPEVPSEEEFLDSLIAGKYDSYIDSKNRF